jgi:hypothetical protein
MLAATQGGPARAVQAFTSSRGHDVRPLEILASRDGGPRPRRDPGRRLRQLRNHAFELCRAAVPAEFERIQLGGPRFSIGWRPAFRIRLGLRVSGDVGQRSRARGERFGGRFTGLGLRPWNQPGPC